MKASDSPRPGAMRGRNRASRESANDRGEVECRSRIRDGRAIRSQGSRTAMEARRRAIMSDTGAFRLLVRPQRVLREPRDPHAIDGLGEATLGRQLLVRHRVDEGEAAIVALP